MRLTFLHSNKKCLYIHIAIFYCGQFQIIRIKHVLRINADINIINAELYIQSLNYPYYICKKHKISYFVPLYSTGQYYLLTIHHLK